MGLFNSSQFNPRFSSNKVMITSGNVGSSICTSLEFNRSFEFLINSSMVNLVLVKPMIR